MRKRPARPADVVAIATPCLLLVVAAAGGRSSEWIFPVIVWSVVAAAGLAIVHFRSKVPGRAMHVLGTFWVTFAIPAVYGTLNPVIDLLNPRLLDAYFVKNDLLLFGVHPTIWLEGKIPPPLVDLMIVCYATFYFWPLILAGVLYAKGRVEDVDHLALLIVLGFFLNYACYVAVPVVGPRFALAPLYEGVPEGWLIGTQFWESFLYIPTLRDCFPSGHTAMTLLTLGFAFSRQRWFFWAMLPIAVPLMAATVLLRFHYVIDLIIAVPFALGAWMLAGRLHRLSLAKSKTQGTEMPCAN